MKHCNIWHGITWYRFMLSTWTFSEKLKTLLICSTVTFDTLETYNLQQPLQNTKQSWNYRTQSCLPASCYCLYYFVLVFSILILALQVIQILTAVFLLSKTACKRLKNCMWTTPPGTTVLIAKFTDEMQFLSRQQPEFVEISSIM